MPPPVHRKKKTDDAPAPKEPDTDDPPAFKEPDFEKVNTDDTLNAIAEWIRRALDRAYKHDFRRLIWYRRAGEGLNRAKELCPPGDWEKMLRANFDFSDRQAQKYMRFAKAPRKALLEEEEEAWRKASGAKNAEPKNRPGKDDTDVPDDGSEEFIPTLTKEEAGEIVPVLKELTRVWSTTTVKETVFRAIHTARKVVAS